MKNLADISLIKMQRADYGMRVVRGLLGARTPAEIIKLHRTICEEIDRRYYRLRARGGACGKRYRLCRF